MARLEDRIEEARSRRFPEPTPEQRASAAQARLDAERRQAELDAELDRAGVGGGHIR